MHTRTKVATLVTSLVIGAGAVGLLGAADASALNRVDNCANRSDLFTTYSTTGNSCWANNGYTSVALYSVAQVNTGYNSGLYIASSSTYRFQSYQYKTHTNYPTITYIEITGR